MLETKTTEQLGLELRKTLSSHQQAFREVVDAVRPALEAWSRSNSQRTTGSAFGIRYAWAVLGRKLWRSVVVGQTFPAVQPVHSFDWRRHGDRLLVSIFGQAAARRDQWTSTQHLSAIQESNLGPSWFAKFCSRFPLPVSDLPADFETDRPVQAFWADFLCALSKRLPRRESEVTIVLDLLAREFRSLLATGYRHQGWNIVGLKRTPYPRGDFSVPPLPGLDLPNGLGALTRDLIKNAIETWAETQPDFWNACALERAALKSIRAAHRSRAFAFWGHPDLSPFYLARAEACAHLGIPVIETQHGGYFGRFEHEFGKSCQNPSDLYVGFGEYTKTIETINSRGVPGVFFRTRFLKRAQRRVHPSPVRVLFGSYFIMDFDECEFPCDEGDLVSAEVEALRRLAHDSRFEVHLKLRPGAHGTIYGHLDEETRRNVKIVEPHAKAGQRLIAQYDVLVNCHFSSLLLEAGSIGTPVVYAAPATERNQLRPDFLRSVTDSPNEIALVDPSEVCEAALKLSQLPAAEQPFSLNYCRYATPQRLRETASALHAQILASQPK